MLTSSMESTLIIIIFHVLLSLQLHPAKAHTWIKAGYWDSGTGFPISDINSTLYTHLICAFAHLNSSTYRLFISTSDDQSFSAFTNTLKQKNPSLTTLLSIGGYSAEYSTFSMMVSKSSYRKSFIDESIKIARLYGFQGLDFMWVSANTKDDMANMGSLFQEWRAAVVAETSNSSQSELILTAAVRFSPISDFFSFPIDSIRRNLNWVHVMAYEYEWADFTGAFAALYDPGSHYNTDLGITEWIKGGLSATKLVLGLPFYSCAWTLADPKDSFIGAPATGPAITEDGYMSYKDTKAYIQRYGAQILYNATYVMNYCVVGSAWIAFDDVEVVKLKVAYAQEKGLLGYFVWQVPDDDHWMLSQAAAMEDQKEQPKQQLLIIILTTTAAVVLLLGLILYCAYLRMLTSKAKESKLNVNNAAPSGNFNSNIVGS